MTRPNAICAWPNVNVRLNCHFGVVPMSPAARSALRRYEASPKLNLVHRSLPHRTLCWEQLAIEYPRKISHVNK